jgi:predicted ABC-type ATPase
MARAAQEGYFVRFFFVSTGCPSINAARITKRYLQGGHAVPIEKIVSRYYKSIQQCVEVVPWVERMDVFDNSREGADAWERLFKYGPQKQLEFFVDPADMPEWVETLYREARYHHDQR